MRNYQEICNLVAVGVKDAMLTAIADGEHGLCWERYFGSAIVIVEVVQRNESGYLHTYTYVTIAHEDARHHSPRLSAAIVRSLPDWDDEERKIRLRYAKI